MGYVRRDASAAGADIAAILVDTSTTLDDLVDDLEARLTAARAGYLDNLSGGAVALAASVGTLANTGGTATLGGILGDVANSSVATQLANLGGRMVSKTITHDGSASYTAFTVTGLVAVKVVGYVTTALTDDPATTSVGTATSAAGLIAATAGSVMQTANQVWVDDAPSKFETFPANWVLIGDGEDIVVDGDAALVAGVVDLFCWYIAISSGASVVAAA